jgi:hypothetical protein
MSALRGSQSGTEVGFGSLSTDCARLRHVGYASEADIRPTGPLWVQVPKFSHLRVSVLRKKEYEWEVVRLRARDEYLGKVKAADEEGALKAAVKAFAITDPEHKKRLLVRRYA